MPTITHDSSSFLSTCALVFVTACANASPDATPAAELTAGLQHVLDQSVAQADDLLPGAISHHQRSARAAWSGSAGLADMQAHATIRANDRVRAGSILKTFLATVILQHVEEGTLSLEQPLSELLDPEVTAQIASSDRITLRMLLNHTSGIPEWVTPDIDAQVVSDPAHVYSAQEAVELASQQAPWFEPGTSWRYSNTNYTLVGMLLERLGQGSWREQLEARVFQPLQLSATFLPESGDLTLPSDLAHGYQSVDGSTLDLSSVDSSMAGAAGGHALITSAADLSHFIEALLGGALFAHQETLTEMTTMIDAPDESGLPHRYGLGLESYVLPSGVEVIGHSGTTAGYAVMMFRVRDRDATLVTAVNAGNLFTNAMHVFIPSVDLITGTSEQP